MTAGCGWISLKDPLAETRKDLGFPITQAGRKRTANGEVVFYRYQQDATCGFGSVVTFRGGGNGGMAGSRFEDACQQETAISQGFGGVAEVANGAYVWYLYGAIYDPQVRSVKVTLEDGRQLNAGIGDGVYFLVLSGQGPLRPKHLSVEGFDKRGASLGKLFVPSFDETR